MSLFLIEQIKFENILNLFVFDSINSHKEPSRLKKYSVTHTYVSAK